MRGVVHISYRYSVRFTIVIQQVKCHCTDELYINNLIVGNPDFLVWIEVSNGLKDVFAIGNGNSGTTIRYPYTLGAFLYVCTSLAIVNKLEREAPGAPRTLPKSNLLGACVQDAFQEALKWLPRSPRRRFLEDF